MNPFFKVEKHFFKVTALGTEPERSLDGKTFKRYLKTKELIKHCRKYNMENSFFSSDDFQRQHDIIRRFRGLYFKVQQIVEYRATCKGIPGKANIRVTATTLKDLLQARRVELSRQRRESRKLFVTRTERRTSAYSESYGRRTIETVGGVHLEPGYFLRLRQRRLTRLVFENKTPKTDEHHVGIELEFTASADRDRLGAALFNAGLAEYVTLKHDGSIRVEKQGHFSHELVICVSESKLDSIVKKATDVLADFDASVNKSTGFHVHIDVRNRNRDSVFGRLVAAQGLLYAMQPASRRDNTYCKRTKTRDRFAASKAGRYQGVNPESIGKHSTVEVRLHAGTVSFEKIVNWVRLLINVADCANTIPPRAPRTLDSFCKVFNVGDQLRQYIKARLDKFANVADDQAEAS